MCHICAGLLSKLPMGSVRVSRAYRQLKRICRVRQNDGQQQRARRFRPAVRCFGFLGAIVGFVYVLR